MSRKHNHKPEKIVFTECEDCGTYPAMWRWFNGKTQCSECATKDFKQYLAAIAAGVVAILIIGFFIF